MKVEEAKEEVLEKQALEAPEKPEQEEIGDKVKVEGRSEESEEAKVEEHKPEEHKVEEYKPEEHTVEEHKVEEHKVEEQPKEPLSVQPEAQPEKPKEGTKHLVFLFPTINDNK